MNFKPTRAAVLISALLLIFLGSVFASIQNETINKDAILAALRELRRGDSQDFLVDKIRQVGVDFKLSEQVKGELTKAGATTKLIEAIRANYRPPLTPKPTPEPSPIVEIKPSPEPSRRMRDIIFSGTWAEDKSKSEGVSTRFTAIREITQNDKQISISSKLVDPEDVSRTDLTNLTRIYSLDGKELTTQTGDRTAVTSAIWSNDGNILELLTVTTTLTSSGEVKITTRERLTLSDNGALLTVYSHSDTPRGPRDSKQVFYRVRRGRSPG